MPRRPLSELAPAQLPRHHDLLLQDLPAGFGPTLQSLMMLNPPGSSHLVLAPGILKRASPFSNPFESRFHVVLCFSV